MQWVPRPKRQYHVRTQDKSLQASLFKWAEALAEVFSTQLSRKKTCGNSSTSAQEEQETSTTFSSL
jgi:hypothetical protein